MLHRNCLAVGLVFIASTTAVAGNPTPQSNMWRKIGFGHGPGYHAFNACPPCAAAPTQHGRGGMNYYGGYYVPGAHPGPQAGWFSHNAGPETWSDSMVHGGPLSPVSADGETMIISDDPISTNAVPDENIPAPKPNAAGKSSSNASPPPPVKSQLPAAPKAKQPPVKPAPDKDDERPAAGDASPKSASNQLQGLQLGDGPGENEETSTQGLSLPIEMENADDGFPNDEPAGALLPE